MNHFRHFVDGEKSTSHEFTFFIGNRSLDKCCSFEVWEFSRSKTSQGFAYLVGHKRATKGVCFSKLLKTFRSEKLFYVQAIYQHMEGFLQKGHISQ